MSAGLRIPQLVQNWPSWFRVPQLPHVHSLGTGGTGLGSVMLAALPAAVLAAALLVLLPRRNR